MDTSLLIMVLEVTWVTMATVSIYRAVPLLVRATSYWRYILRSPQDGGIRLEAFANMRREVDRMLSLLIALVIGVVAVVHPTAWVTLIGLIGMMALDMKAAAQDHRVSDQLRKYLDGDENGNVG